MNARHQRSVRAFSLCVGLLGGLASLGAQSSTKFIDFYYISSYAYNPKEDYEPTPHKAVNTIPPEVLALNGQKISISGNVLPLDFDKGGSSTFILNSNVDACGFGATPRINEWIHVTLPGKKVRVNAGDEVLVRGTFKVEEQVEQGLVVGLYSMIADSAQ